jgi:hypothetical protein
MDILIAAACSNEMFSGIYQVVVLMSIHAKARTSIQKLTLAVISAGTIVYCWKVAFLLLNAPRWNLNYESVHVY